MPAGKIVAKLRMEKKGRGGKTVTVIADLPRNASFLKELCQELKRACGTGGAVSEDTIELQGDLRDRVRHAELQLDTVGLFRQREKLRELPVGEGGRGSVHFISEAALGAARPHPGRVIRRRALA